MSIVDQLLSLVAPYDCLLCGSEGRLLCASCSQTIPAFPSRCYRCKRLTDDFRTCRLCRSTSNLYRVWVGTMYDAAAKELVYKLKFDRCRKAADDMAALLADCLEVRECTVISHIPTAPARVRQRGYDQAALIARALARRVGISYATLLVRTGEQRQVGQKRTQRQRQMRNAFRAIRPELLNQHVLLIDDVLTTGATCEAAAQALKSAGARRVSAAVFAAA